MLWLQTHLQQESSSRQTGQFCSSYPTRNDDLPSDTSRTKRIRLIPKIGKALPRLGGNGKTLGGIPHLSITTTMDLTLIERRNLRKSVNHLFTCGMSLTMNLVQNYSDQFRNSQRSLLSPTGGVKSTSSYYRKLATKFVYLQPEQHNTNHINNKYTMTRTPTRASCTTCEHALRARSLRLSCDVVSHAPHGSRCS